MKLIKLLPFLFLSICFQSALAQLPDVNAIDTPARMIWTGANFNVQFPAGKLAETFRVNYNIGTGVTLKTSSNWTYSANFNYLFGSKLRHLTLPFYQELFGDIFTQDGQVIDAGEMATDVYFEGRYWTLNAGFGKIIPVTKKWKNSGIWIHGNFGYFRHKIFINDPENHVLQFKGDYKKGYDRRSSGFMMSQFIGYLFMQKVRVASFYGGIEITEMWTKPDRNYIFTLGPTKDMKYEFSALIGLKIGWIIPLHEKKKAVTYYTY